MGVLTPVGAGRNAFFSSLLSAHSGIGAVVAPFAGQLKIRIAAQVKDFDPTAHFDVRRLSQLDRYTQLALVAAREAHADARLQECDAGTTVGVYFGTSLGGAGTLEAGYEELFRKGSGRVRPLSVVAAMPNAAAANIALDFGIKGPCITYSVACASSAIAIGEAARAIASGAVSVAVAGGSEALLTYGVMKSWESLMTLAIEDRAAPHTSCRPFARDRTGLVLAEGAGVVILEDLEAAAERGAGVHAEIVGYGLSNDGIHLSRPDAEGQARAMSAAIAEAGRHGVDCEDIGYVNAHGTATKAGDKVETESIKRAFGNHARRVAISSTKALHGHLMGAGGAVELIAAILAMEQELVPPTAHLWQPDPECDLDYVPLEPRSSPGLAAVMSNSFAFGGTNAVLIARRVSL
jgi:3-oxoacyl-[acyl-carrier-protein] synthase II